MTKKEYIQMVKNDVINNYINGMSSVALSQKYNLTPTTICKILRDNNISVRSNKVNSRKYQYDNNYFNQIDSCDKAYWLGFIYADGYVSSAQSHKKVGIALALNDKAHLEKLKLSLNATYPIKEYISSNGYNKGKKYCRLEIYDEIIYSQLISHGVFENKTDILIAPNISLQFQKDFIRGYLDGDGCITKSLNRNNKYDYKVKFAGTENILNYIIDFLNINEIANINRLYKRKKEQVVSCFEFGGNKQVKKFLKLIYNDANIYLDRKYKKYIELSNLYNE